MSDPISLSSSLDSGFILLGTYWVAPSRVEEFLNYMKAIYDNVIHEPECRFFVVGTDMQEPGRVSLSEGWTKDADWFVNVQLKKEYYWPYFEATKPMYLKKHELRFLSPSIAMNYFKAPEPTSMKSERQTDRDGT